jgi:hypothetical protein
MTTKADFTEEEWARLRRAPLVAGMAISLADPGGPIEVIKETSAAAKSILDAAQGGEHGDLVREVATDAAEQIRQRRNPVSEFKPRGVTAGQEILDELKGVNDIVTAKASPAEATQFRDWLKSSAQRSADAAKEGGFLGFGAEQVSEGEQKMLDRLDEVLAD